MDNTETGTTIMYYNNIDYNYYYYHYYNYQYYSNYSDLSFLSPSYYHNIYQVLLFPLVNVVFVFGNTIQILPYLILSFRRIFATFVIVKGRIRNFDLTDLTEISDRK